MKNLLDNVRKVADGTKMPEASSTEYASLAVSWAEKLARPGESTFDSYQRLAAAKRAKVFSSLRRAAAIARMFEGDLDPRPLIESLGYKPGEESFEYESRLDTWEGLLELAEPFREDDEALGDCLRRLIESNGAASCAFFYVISEVKPR